MAGNIERHEFDVSCTVSQKIDYDYQYLRVGRKVYYTISREKLIAEYKCAFLTSTQTNLRELFIHISVHLLLHNNPMNFNLIIFMRLN